MLVCFHHSIVIAAGPTDFFVAEHKALGSKYCYCCLMSSWPFSLQHLSLGKGTDQIAAGSMDSWNYIILSSFLHFPLHTVCTRGTTNVYVWGDERTHYWYQTWLYTLLSQSTITADYQDKWITCWRCYSLGSPQLSTSTEGGSNQVHKQEFLNFQLNRGHKLQRKIKNKYWETSICPDRASVPPVAAMRQVR